MAYRNKTTPPCKCGCGQQAAEYRSNGRFKGYLKYAVGCKRVVTADHLAQKVAALAKGRKSQSKPIGSRRITLKRDKPYWEIKVSETGRWKLEHRYIMEGILGRSLKSSEHVHHGDNNGLNNDPKNLKLLTHSQHTSHHFSIYWELNKKAAALDAGRWSRKFPCCVRCGATTRPHCAKGACKNCYEWLRRNR